MRRLLASIFVAFVVLVACFGVGCGATTNLVGGLAPCAADGDCPSDYHCANDNKCWRNGDNPFSAQGDAAAPCSGALVDCGGGLCVDPRTSTQHCGATAGCGIEGAGSAGDSCINGLVCNGGVCAVSCPGNQVNCDGTCVDPATDPRHCGATAGCGADAGAAGEACTNGRVCNSGACASSCSATDTNCGGSCVDTKTSPTHCGDCATSCALTNTMNDACVNGRCAVAACGTGFGDCDGIASNGCETATKASDVNNCGGCGVRCQYANADALCNAGTCARGACDPGFADCDGNPANGCETNTAADVNSCGACGTPCVGGQVCSMGACAATCGTGLTNCSGSCVNQVADAQHCGSCTKVCALANASINACAARSCVVGACAAGFGDCDGAAGNGCETATGASDVNNCGGCGVRCSFANASASCGAGVCAMGACNPGFADCDGNPANGCEVNTRADNGNCGACRNTCADGKVCSSGTCGTTCGAGLTNCSGSCANEVTDVQHCGSCTNACALANVSVNACASSSCVVGACANGYGDCDGLAGNGCETATKATDVNNCGGCGIKCSFANAGASCATGTCVMGTCNAGFADCDGNPANGCEVNTSADNGNCGACTNACANGKVCSGGMCGTTCGMGLDNCSGSCVNEATDVQHCGSCTNACSLSNVATNACASRSCVVGACANGYGDCDGLAANGCEVATKATDVNNCGGCGIKCNFANAGASCATGSCVMGACNAGFADCDGNAANGCEVNTRSDNGNCGACLNNCPNGQMCSSSACSTTCGGGLINCSGSCFDLASSPTHCGTCATNCPNPPQTIPVCAASSCAFVCQAGFGNCDGNPANGCEKGLTSDSNNCGFCGNVCPGGGMCSAGSCPVLYAVGVTVLGLTGSGLVLQNNGGNNLTINASGSYPFATQIPNGGMYAVTVLRLPTSMQYCAPVSGSGTVMSASVNITVNCFGSPTGGSVSDIGGYRIHTFPSSGTFQTFGPMDVDYLVVGGGGGGGSGDGGGGGGGGVLGGSATTGTSSYAVVVGAGGAGAGLGETGTPAANGFDSSFLGVTALGGGFGGREDNTGGGGPKNFAGNGGSGGGFGGANAPSPFPAGGLGTAGQGTNGGTRGPGSFGMGGGGGAGGVGGDGNAGHQGGAGGAGLGSAISGALAYYGAGGGGAGRAAGGGVGGVGGGGNGGTSNVSGTGGATNTGSGGGGGGDQTTSGGAGGSGVVLVRYPYAGPAMVTFNATTASAPSGTLQHFTVPAGVTSITVQALGASGGDGSIYGCICSLAPPGKGASIQGTFAVTPGDVLDILVGQKGGSSGGPHGNENGGGGGSFVVKAAGNIPLVIAGGGGGAPSTNYGTSCVRDLNAGNGQAGTSGGSANCSGFAGGGTGGGGGTTLGSLEGGAGGGFTGNGANGGTHCSVAVGGLSYLNGGGGGAGNTCYSTTNFGGYGGGGGGMLGGPGGGGGYSGGASAGSWTSFSTYGGGGGSYNGGANVTNTAGANLGAGKVTISY